jgi:hypothetical protein
MGLAGGASILFPESLFNERKQEHLTAKKNAPRLNDFERGGGCSSVASPHSLVADVSKGVGAAVHGAHGTVHKKLPLALHQNKGAQRGIRGAPDKTKEENFHDNFLGYVST